MTITHDIPHLITSTSASSEDLGVHEYDTEHDGIVLCAGGHRIGRKLTDTTVTARTAQTTTVCECVIDDRNGTGDVIAAVAAGHTINHELGVLHRELQQHDLVQVVETISKLHTLVDLIDSHPRHNLTPALDRWHNRRTSRARLYLHSVRTSTPELRTVARSLAAHTMVATHPETVPTTSNPDGTPTAPTLAAQVAELTSRPTRPTRPWLVSIPTCTPTGHLLETLSAVDLPLVGTAITTPSWYLHAMVSTRISGRHLIVVDTADILRTRGDGASWHGPISRDEAQSIIDQNPCETVVIAASLGEHDPATGHDPVEVARALIL